jgi:4'-phosphopantetheinyl transferase
VSPQVWLVDLDTTAPALEACETSSPRLSAADHVRIAQVADPGNRRLRRAATLALRLVLERAFGIGLRAVDLPRDAFGRPMLPAATGPGDFSLSHAGRFALIGCIQGKGARIGVDLEAPIPGAAPRGAHISAARRHIIVESARLLCDAHPPTSDSPAAFLSAWVRLEALAKADGRGIGHLLTAIGALGGTAGRDVSAARGLALAHRCRVVDLDVGRHMFAAVAHTGPPDPVIVRTMEC